MRIMLRQTGSERFFVGYDKTAQWSEDEQQALTFPSYRAAAAVCASQKLKEVEILIKYQAAEDIVMPMPSREEFAPHIDSPANL